MDRSRLIRRVRALPGGLLLLATSAFTATGAAAISPDVVISQLYGAGGNTGATLNRDYIELFNRGASPVSLTGWSVQYTSAAGTGLFSSFVTPLGATTLQPGQYYLVGMTVGAVGAATPTPDATGTTAMAAGAGKVIVTNTTTGLACNGGSTPCSTAQLAQIVDLVGYGAANFFEGTGPTPTLNATTSAFRADGGCTDTDNNAADFAVAAPGPRNTASALHPCGGGDAAPFVSSTTPSDGATGVAVDANISVTFSEPVTVIGTWFTINCVTSLGHTATATGGPTTFTLNPDSDFATGEACTLTVVAAQVSDVDTNDPPDIMATDFGATFTTAAPVVITLIHDIQGSGATSPVTGQTKTIQGIVVGDFQGPSAGGLGGFFVQEEDADADADPGTSEGIFVFQGSSGTAVALGDQVRVSGTVTEFTSSGSSQTELSTVTAVQVQSTGNVLPTSTTISLPAATSTALERDEGMRVHFAQDLVVSETFTLARFGELVLTSGDRLFTPTQIVEPGAPAIAQQTANDLDMITLDDGRDDQNPPIVRYPEPAGLSASNTVRVGDTVEDLDGVIEERFGGYRVQPVETVAIAATNPRPATPPAVGGSLRVAFFNVLNYFNGDGLGGGFPTARGAETPAEYTRQHDKIVAALTLLDGDIVGLSEIENDTSGPNSAISQLVAGLNGATSPGQYAYIDTGVVGTDEIRVALIYQPSAATPTGSFDVLTSADDSRFLDTKNRPALAQTFTANATGARFTVIVNHLKSKGSDCNDVGDPDTGDGQGNCNVTRTQAARALVDWIATDPTGSGDPDALLIGDYNSYAKEDPIDVFRAAGYADLAADLIGPGAYSYVFDATSGTLDYALSSPSLTSQVTGAAEWHINADESVALDYNTNFKSIAQQSSFYAPDPYRSSDHDPMVVGLGLLPELTALSPAKAWIGLKNSDDVGTNFDLQAEVFKNGSLIASNVISNVSGGSTGFNRAVNRSIALALGSPTTIAPSDKLSIKLSVRIGATGHRSGTARLWFNDTQANSSFDATIGGVNKIYYLRDGFVLGTSPAPATSTSKKTVDVFVDRLVGGNPFKPFGTWVQP